MSSSCTDKNNPCFLWTNRHSQFGTYSHLSFNQTSSNCRFHNSPAKGWPYEFLSRGTTGASILDHDLGHLCRGRRIQMSGHSGFGIFSNLGPSSNFTWVHADNANAACLSQSGNFAITFMIFAAVICEADDPCSANTACAPESSLTMSPRSMTLPWNFCNLGSNSAFFRWHKSINVAKWTSLLFFCASRMTLFCFELFPVSRLESSRAFSILCPLQLLHLGFLSPSAAG